MFDDHNNLNNLAIIDAVAHHLHDVCESTEVLTGDVFIQLQEDITKYAPNKDVVRQNVQKLKEKIKDYLKGYLDSKNIEAAKKALNVMRFFDAISECCTEGDLNFITVAQRYFDKCNKSASAIAIAGRLLSTCIENTGRPIPKDDFAQLCEDIIPIGSSKNVAVQRFWELKGILERAKELSPSPECIEAVNHALRVLYVILILYHGQAYSCRYLATLYLASLPTPVATAAAAVVPYQSPAAFIEKTASSILLLGKSASECDLDRVVIYIIDFVKRFGKQLMLVAFDLQREFRKKVALEDLDVVEKNWGLILSKILYLKHDDITKYKDLHEPATAAAAVVPYRHNQSPVATGAVVPRAASKILDVLSIMTILISVVSQLVSGEETTQDTYFAAMAMTVLMMMDYRHPIINQLFLPRFLLRANQPSASAELSVSSHQISQPSLSPSTDEENNQLSASAEVSTPSIFFGAGTPPNSENSANNSSRPII